MFTLVSLPLLNINVLICVTALQWHFKGLWLDNLLYKVSDVGKLLASRFAFVPIPFSLSWSAEELNIGSF